MQIKTWQKILFFGSIGVLIAYLQKDRVKKVYSTISNNLLEFANKWKGVVEIGENSSFQNDVFQTMLKNVGWKSGEAWCMYFAKAIHWETYVTQRNLINKILVGNTQNSLVNAQNDKTGTYTVSNTPKVGDIVIWRNQNVPTRGHAGLVTKVNDNGTINTIEGNTSFVSATEGDTVENKVRKSAIGSVLDKNVKLRGYIRKL